MQLQREYASIDIAKFFFCLCILFLHTGAYHEIPFSWFFLHLLLRLAVPFFFVTSGYFLGNKIWNSTNDTLSAIIGTYLKRLTAPYIVFSIINSFMAGIDMYSNGESFLWTLLRLARAAIFYPYGALWYIWASIIGIILLYWFIKNEHLLLALLFGLFGYVFALLCNSYYFHIEGTCFQHFIDIYLKITTSARNGLFVGFLLLGIGINLAKLKEKVFQKKFLLFASIAASLSAITLLLETTYIRNKTVADDHSLFLSHLILIPALLIILLNLHLSHSSSAICLIRKLSTGFYFIHRPLLSLLTKFLTAIGYADISKIFHFVILFVLCLFICLPYYSLKLNYKKNTLQNR